MRGYTVHGFRTVTPPRHTEFVFDLSPFIAATVLYGSSNPVAELGARGVLGVSPMRFVQLLNRLLDTELALQLDPVVVYRLRRVRELRRRGRSVSRTA